jgi:ribonuclease BN (tRNA processing enzyme)
LPRNGTFGGHSSCVEIVGVATSTSFATWAAAPVRSARRKSPTYGVPNPQTYHIFISHLHWDHLMGFPLFHAHVHSRQPHHHSWLPSTYWKNRFRLQMQAPSFPVDYAQAGAKIEFDLS